MQELLANLLPDSGLGLQILTLGAIAIGALLALYGVSSALSERSTAASRMAPRRNRDIGLSADTAGLKEDRPLGLSATLIPNDENERLQVGLALVKAGFRGDNLIAKYYLVRLTLGILLPGLYIAGMYVARLPEAPGWLAGFFTNTNALSTTQHIAVLCAVGFFGPAYWLRSRINGRKQKIEEAFPNMLDLLQVGVEAGMGFDQALLKVAVEIQVASPEIAEELLTALSEIQAGRDRDTALMRMARRTGIDEVLSFVNVILQSSKFGSPLSDALSTYSEEMRERRELKAQEKANKLPVQMSAVMAFLMLPSLIALILAPIIIRYVDTFGAG